MVALEVIRFIQPFSACLIFETERKIRVLTTALVHVRNDRFNLLRFALILLLLPLTFYSFICCSTGAWITSVIMRFIIWLHWLRAIYNWSSIEYIYGITQTQVKTSSIFYSGFRYTCMLFLTGTCRAWNYPE